MAEQTAVSIPRVLKTKKWEPFLRYSSLINSGESKTLRLHVAPKPSLVITRNLSGNKAADQQFVPPRFLIGLVPSALLDNYEWWQNTDDSITGYPVLNRDGNGMYNAATNAASGDADLAGDATGAEARRAKRAGGAGNNASSTAHARYIIHIDFLRPPSSTTAGAVTYSNWKAYTKDRAGS